MPADAGWDLPLTFVRAFHQSQASRRSRPSRLCATTSSPRLNDRSRHVSNAFSSRARRRNWRTAAQRSLRVRDRCARSCHCRKTRSRSSDTSQRAQESQSPVIRRLGTAHTSACVEPGAPSSLTARCASARTRRCSARTVAAAQPANPNLHPMRSNRRQPQDQTAQSRLGHAKRLTLPPSHSTT